MSGGSAEPTPPRKEPRLGQLEGNEIAARSPAAGLHVALLQLDAALIAEGIDPSSPLGVWSQAQKAMIHAMIGCVTDLATRVDDQVARVGAVADTQLKALQKAIESANASRAASVQEIERLKEERLTAMDDVAIRMADKIRDELKRTILVREKRWNLKQNLRYAGFGSLLLFAAYLGGVYYQGQEAVRDIIELCRKYPTVDQRTKVQYCTLGLIDGSAKPVDLAGAKEPPPR